VDKKIEKIIWAEDGIKSFEDTIHYIAKDSPYYASSFANKILFSIEKLTWYPNIGRIVPEYNIPSIRELIYQNYRIVYKIDNKAVYILLVIHGTHGLPEII
jgi:plasmid stabilization system protein ParE